MRKRLAAFIVFSVCLLTSITALSDMRSAILIGVDQYDQEGQVPVLQSASSDAQELGQILSQNGYVCRIMVDENATKEQITEAFIQMEQQTSQASPLDVFLFYFSGRGTRIPDDIQADEVRDNLDECILPSDAVSGNPRSYIRDDTLARWMTAINAKQVILILDCAFWGDNANSHIKGIGPLTKTKELDGMEMEDGLAPEAIIISAGLPDIGVQDGVFTKKFLDSCATEEADGDADRVISFSEAYQFAFQQLQRSQSPRMVDPNAAYIPLAPLPPLSRLQIESEPPQAEILLYKDSKRLQLDETQYTPAGIPLRKGEYRIQVQKNGFLIPEPKKVDIGEYNTRYVMDVFKLEPMEVVGEVNVVGNTGESIFVKDGMLTVHINTDEKEIHQEPLSEDGKFRFGPGVYDWISVGSQYELRVIGRPVLSTEPVQFTYDGYNDINITLAVVLDNISPVLSLNGVTFQTARLVAGEEIRGSIQAKDDGLGLMDNIEIQLQSPDNAESVTIPASSIQFQTPGSYEFSYAIPDAASSTGEWHVSAVVLEDKAGNKTELSSDQINAVFHAFASRFDLGRYYFDTEDYDKALGHLGRIDPPTDDAHYFSALAYYQKNDIIAALAAFQKAGDKSRYLGQARPGDMPQMPRKMVNRFWGGLLDNFDENKEDASYLELLAITAEELGRSYEAKVYHERAEGLR